MNNLLGRKRKPNDRKEKYKTPDKNTDKFLTPKYNQTSTQKIKSPPKNSAKKK